MMPCGGPWESRRPPSMAVPELSLTRWLLGLVVMTAGVIFPLLYIVATKNRAAFAKAPAKYTQ